MRLPLAVLALALCGCIHVARVDYQLHRVLTCGSRVVPQSDHAELAAKTCQRRAAPLWCQDGGTVTVGTATAAGGGDVAGFCCEWQCEGEAAGK